MLGYLTVKVGIIQLGTVSVKLPPKDGFKADVSSTTKFKAKIDFAVSF